MNEIQYIQKHGVKSACELIELLGGYEKAKAEFAEQLKAEKQYPNEKENNERILLDYRRANNIFEVGDRVVLLKNQHMWHKMESIYTVASTDIYEGVTIGVAIRDNNTSFGDELGNIRHATDQEIESKLK